MGLQGETNHPVMKVRMADIAQAVCDKFGLTVQSLRGPRRPDRLARPRFLFCLLCRELASKSYPEIGRYLGDRDHSTIMHAEMRALELIERDDAMAEAFLSIRSRLLEQKGAA